MIALGEDIYSTILHCLGDIRKMNIHVVLSLVELPAVNLAILKFNRHRVPLRVVQHLDGNADVFRHLAPTQPAMSRARSRESASEIAERRRRPSALFFFQKREELAFARQTPMPALITFTARVMLVSTSGGYAMRRLRYAVSSIFFQHEEATSPIFLDGFEEPPAYFVQHLPEDDLSGESSPRFSAAVPAVVPLFTANVQALTSVVGRSLQETFSKPVLLTDESLLCWASGVVTAWIVILAWRTREKHCTWRLTHSSNSQRHGRVEVHRLLKSRDVRVEEHAPSADTSYLHICGTKQSATSAAKAQSLSLMKHMAWPSSLLVVNVSSPSQQQ